MDPAIKATAEWCGANAKAMVNESRLCPTQTFVCGPNQTNISHLRAVARGEVDPNQYKERFGLKRDNGKGNKSYRNLNYAILKVAPGIRNNLVNRMMEKMYRVNVKATDPLAMNQRRQILAQIESDRANQEAMAEFERISRLKLERQFTDEQLSMSPQEVDVELEMNPYDLASLEVKDYLTMTLGLNDWDVKSEDICGDLADGGTGVAHVYIDEVGVIKVDRWMPERVVTNRCVKRDFSDMIRVGVFQDITVTELKARTKGKIGKKGEDDYREIAKKVAEGGASRYNKSFENYYDETRYAYRYDHEKVTVFTCYWYSVDQFTYKTFTTGAGNMRTKPMPFGHVPSKGDPNVNDGKGYSDEEFNKMNGGAEMIYRNEIRNVYKCSWVVDTDYVYDFGLMTNMPRYAKSLAETKLPVIISTTDFMSPFGNVENMLDMVQLEWLQFQAHTASSKPPGIAIERNALMRVGAKPGQAGKSTDWKKALQMYAETGSIVYDGYDQHGNPLNQIPIMELANGLPAAAQQHWEMMVGIITMIRNMLGINDLVAGENPAERLGKAVAEMSFGAAELNISHMHRAYKSIYERVCKMVVDLIPDAFDKGVLPGFVDMLGMESFQFFNINRDLNLRDMGIQIQEGPDAIVKERISMAIQIAIDRQELDPEDAIYVELEDNPYRAIQILKRKRKQKQKEAMEANQANMEYQSQMIQAETQNAAQMDQAKMGMEFEHEEGMTVLQSQLQRQSDNEKFTQEFLLAKMKAGMELTRDERLFMQNKALAYINGQFMLRGKKIAASKKPTSSSSKR